MTRLVLPKGIAACVAVVAAIVIGGFIVSRRVRKSDEQNGVKAPAIRKRTLSHEETLRWVGEHKAWRQARKTRAIWARPVTSDEVGKEFQTADHVVETARAGYWLCVGVAEEPWFQTREKINAKYEPGEERQRSFPFDDKPHSYQVFKPRGEVRNWVAQVKGPDIEGFHVRPNYDPSHSLYSPVGGYVVKDDVKDPYTDKPGDVWLVQQSLFESTYELIRETP